MAGGKKKGRTLTEQQKKFADEYLISENKYKSAIAAGYSENYAKSKSYLLLENPKIQEYIHKRQKELVRKAVDPERLVSELAAIAFADYSDFVDVEGGVVIVKSLDEIPKAKRAAIVSIKQRSGYMEVQLANKPKALDMLLRITGVYENGLFVEETKAAEGNPFEGLTTEELRKLVQQDGES